MLNPLKIFMMRIFSVICCIILVFSNLPNMKDYLHKVLYNHFICFMNNVCA